MSKAAWSEISKELLRRGFLDRTADRLPVLEITAAGRRLLAGEMQTTILVQQTGNFPVEGYDVALFDRLCLLRRKLVDEQGVPAYMIFNDRTLRLMAKQLPTTSEAFLAVIGVGQSKLRDLGDQFMKEISEHVREHGKRQFEAARVEDTRPAIVGRSERETLNRFQAGVSVEEIAKERGLTPGTVYGHLARAALAGESLELDRFLKPKERQEIAAVGAKYGWANLTAIHEGTGGRYDFNVLRIAREVLRQHAGDS